MKNAQDRDEFTAKKRPNAVWGISEPPGIMYEICCLFLGPPFLGYYVPAPPAELPVPEDLETSQRREGQLEQHLDYFVLYMCRKKRVFARPSGG